MSSREEMLAKGYTCYCLNCLTAYKEVPTKDYADGHDGREIPMCKCGCDLFADLKTDQPVKGEPTGGEQQPPAQVEQPPADDERHDDCSDDG